MNVLNQDIGSPDLIGGARFPGGGIVADTEDYVASRWPAYDAGDEIDQSEFATDVMFPDRASLKSLYEDDSTINTKSSGLNPALK